MKDLTRLGRHLHAVSIIGLAMVLLAGTSPAADPPARASLPLALPVSLLELMRAAVEIPADGLWAIQGADRVSNDEWLLADQDSVSLAAAATLMARPGTGQHDRQWVGNPDWQAWTRDVQKTAFTIRAAAKAKDQTKFGEAADHLAEVCQNCHTKYRPETPSDGVARYPFYPKRELAK